MAHHSQKIKNMAKWLDKHRKHEKKHRVTKIKKDKRKSATRSVTEGHGTVSARFAVRSGKLSTVGLD